MSRSWSRDIKSNPEYRQAPDIEAAKRLRLYVHWYINGKSTFNDVRDTYDNFLETVRLK